MMTWQGLVRAMGALAILGLPIRGSGNTQTTLYVGRHFEIRDHEQPTKYVFYGPTRVGAVIGSLSPSSRVQRIRLWPGWNLISLAVTTSDFLGQIQQTNGVVIQEIYQWNSATSTYSPVATGETLAAGTVLWMNATTVLTVAVVGTYAEPSAQHAGAHGAYLPGTGLEVWSPTLPVGSAGWTYDSEFKVWHAEVPGTLDFISDNEPLVEPGEVIYVRAQNDIDLAVPDPARRIRYYHEDHLGSSSVITDGNGSAIQEQAFYPFGGSRSTVVSASVVDPYQFTQKERDRESGLFYFEARYLASSLARFTKPDPKFINLDTLEAVELHSWAMAPQQNNLYAYVHHNPLAFVDPSGEDDTKPNKPAPVGNTLHLANGGETFLETGISSWSIQPMKKGEPAGDENANEQLLELTITRNSDRLSTSIIRASIEGHGFEGEITMNANQGGNSASFLKLKLTEAHIANYQPGASNSQGPTESFTIVAKVDFIHPQSLPEAPEHENVCRPQNLVPQQIPDIFRLQPQPMNGNRSFKAPSTLFDLFSNQ